MGLVVFRCLYPHNGNINKGGVRTAATSMHCRPQPLKAKGDRNGALN
uniref:Uncharacterized protein n=1 Tax=Anguilla anguilla TaxID=7936 RepID=A0A0E9PQ11_ANGAN